MKRAVIYARVSSHQQAEEGLSIESQIESCKRRAETLGAVVVGTFVDEGISGTTDARPGFRNAVSRCGMGDVNHFICWSSSRFARDQHDAISYKRELAGYGTRLVYAQSEIDLDTHEGWMLDSIQQVIDESYSRAVSRDTKRSMMTAAAEGYFMGGRVPFGYEAAPAAGDERRRRLAIRESEAAVVRQIYSWSREGVGTATVARQLNKEGFSIRGRSWTKNTVDYILGNEVYMGVVIFNRMNRKQRSVRPEAEWVRVPSHPAIISEDEWRAVQQGMRARAPQAEASAANSNHVFTGLLRCGECGGSLQIYTGTGRGKKLYSYYTCRNHRQGVACSFKAVRAEAFDSWMLDALLDKVLTAEVIGHVLGQLDDAAARWHKDRAARRAALVLELRTVEGRRGKLFDAIEASGADTLGLSELGPRLRELNEQAKKLELQLTRLESEPEPMVGQIRVTPDEAAEVFRQTVKGTEDPKTLRAFVATIVQMIVVKPSEVVAHYKPECLIAMDGTPVRSEHSWLLDLGSNQGPTD